MLKERETLRNKKTNGKIRKDDETRHKKGITIPEISTGSSISIVIYHLHSLHFDLFRFMNFFLVFKPLKHEEGDKGGSKNM